MKRTVFTKNQIETVTNLIADGATDEQIIAFAIKSLKMTEATAVELITKIKSQSAKEEAKAEPNEESKKEQPEGTEPKVESKEIEAKEESGKLKNDVEEAGDGNLEGEAPEAIESENPDGEAEDEAQQPNITLTEDEIIDQCVIIIESGQELTELEIQSEFNLSESECQKILAKAKLIVEKNQNSAKSEELNEVKEKVAAQIAESIKPVQKGIDDLVAAIDEAIKVKRSFKKSFSRLASARKELVRLKRVIA